MRIAYIECFAGIAGDMLLGALADSGVPRSVFDDAVNTLNISASIRFESADRSGITATKAHVFEDGKPAEPTHHHHHTHDHDHGHEHHHHHDHAHPHTHDHHYHAHTHGRTYRDIRTLIEAAALNPAVKAMALSAFAHLAAAEAKIHGTEIDSVHFHEVGGVDAIVDIVAGCAGLHALNVEAFHCSPLNVGGGMVECAHGTFPVPAPATAELLRDMPTYSAHIQKELVTPTGAAILRALAPSFGPQPPMRVSQIGYGAGTRNPKNFPNVVRLSIGESDTTAGTVTVLETALDDLSPQVQAYAAEQLLAAGALDVMLTPVLMKKGRPGTLLTVLCAPTHAAELQAVLFRETSTLGVRVRTEQRTVLDRELVTVSTSYGPVRIKCARRNGELLNAAPEYEDCRAAAVQHDVALKAVQQAALAAWNETRSRL